MSRIILNARFTNQALTGVQRVCYELGGRLMKLRGNVEAMAPAAPLPDYDIPITVKPLSTKAPGHLWEQTILRKAAGQADLLVNLNNTGPLGLRRQIVMIHDVNYLLGPDGYSWAFRSGYRVAQSILTKTATICTVSHWSADEIAKAFSIDSADIEVIHNAADHLLDIASDQGAVARFGLSERPYALCVGSANPNKNFSAVVEAYAGIENPDFDLAIVGGSASGVFRSEATAAEIPGVRRLGRVSDEELRALMENAAVFVMPSFLEGFGLPPLEAMALGTPVVTSSASALPEVCGDAALYFDPLQPGEIAKAMCKVIEDRALADQLTALGLDRARQFSWEASARKLSALVDRTLGMA
ncbi:glycosyltransferase family 4 protein [Qipengyuania sphaerica]|uniref:glycosyltransferase family 4 protein n=1 Tax=Qipengyuania sphaerica TaxID=2867243 RepID=UPI001C87D28B|nr:glycosyltransferase family 1 protein [Qipengyuania sphaerica]MBX7540902.1 glycosyltransferase family 4 protein [Qipengyuania sphaerica]